MSQSLLAVDTNHIKRYVFGTNRLKEIRGASSLLDGLNRNESPTIATSKYEAQTIFAHGGSALFLLDSKQAEPLGKALQKYYQEATGGGASVTYAVQPVPDSDPKTIMTASQLGDNVTMSQVLRLLRARLKLAKDTLLMSRSGQEPAQDRDIPQVLRPEQILALPAHALLSPCASCGIAYAEETWHDVEDPDESVGRYCRICINKRKEDERVRKALSNVLSTAVSPQTLWGHILHELTHPRDLKNPLYNQPYRLPERIRRPKDFHAFSDFAGSKDYLGLVYADANGMGQAMDTLQTLQEIQKFAQQVDDAVFAALADTLRAHLPVQRGMLPFDVLLIGGDDIVVVTPAAQALQVAATLAERFHVYTGQKHTLSVGVVLAPIKYPFGLQRMLADETLKAAKKAGAKQQSGSQDTPEQPYINFVVVTGSTSLSYSELSERMYSRKPNQEEFYATMRPYPLDLFQWLLRQLQEGKGKHLGRTKLQQLREAIVKIDRSSAATILEALALLRNWQKDERTFIKDLVKACDIRVTPQQVQQGTLFPWGLDGPHSAEHAVYRTPLLDFIELYDFVS